MDFVRTSVQQPITVAVGVILTLLAGLLAIGRLPIQLTPNVEDTIIGVETFWEGASPQEIEQEIVDKQEEKLQGIANLKVITSTSRQNQGTVRLEFRVGTPKDVALREVSDKLREVPDYPENADEPVIEASDPENRDYIAWIVLSSTDPDLDIRTLGDFAEDRIKPFLERIEGMSEIGVLGGREREVQIRFDPVKLAARGLTPAQLVDAVGQHNLNTSAGQVAQGKLDVRIRTIGQYEAVDTINQTVIKYADGAPVFLSDVAEVVQTFKEPVSFVRSRGEPVIAINAQREVGSNVIKVMKGLKERIAEINAPGGLLENAASQFELNGTLTLTQVYDQTVYIDDAIALVQNNIWIGGSLAILILALFLRSVRTVGIIALAIPISIVGAVVAMVAMGRSVNVISLAGMAFAVGMVVDNAIVVLENVFRHIEMGKKPAQAAYDGAREVWGAVLASTLTTIAVFIPIILIQEEAGLLFRDIALAICAAVGFSMLVAVSVIPSASAMFLKQSKSQSGQNKGGRRFSPFRFLAKIPEAFSRLIYRMSGSILLRVGVVVLFTAVSLIGSKFLAPPADYLPQGNRNLVFGLIIPPPGYSLDKKSELGRRVEETISPFYQAGLLPKDSPEREKTENNLQEVPTFNFMLGMPGDPVVPPPLENYFLVSFEGILFHGAISDHPKRVPDIIPLFNHATRPENTPGAIAFAFQVPLFQLGGTTGSAVKIEFLGPKQSDVIASAGAVYGTLMQKYGPMTVQPDPPNFDIAGPELLVFPKEVQLANVGMTAAELGMAVQTSGDGRIIGDYRVGGESIDLKVISRDAVDQNNIAALGAVPIAAPNQQVIPLATIADIRRVASIEQINRVNRQRAVTLQFTPPESMPLEEAIDEIEQLLAGLKTGGVIPPGIETQIAGSASKLQAVMLALLGDRTFIGTLGSSLVIALIVVYLLMCVLFQSFLYPFVIMFSVPLATLGGFLALRLVFLWSVIDPYMPIQSLDVLTMLGFIILIGVVVNNAILIVHQALNFMKGADGVDPLPPRRAIAESVKSRVRPIFMSMLTSLGGMLPLVLMPGSGSELYRGLGSVVVGGLLVSTLFTLVLVPLLMSLTCDFQARFQKQPKSVNDAVTK
jgi:HAE1 family hydrophobic/amphiphilic exporter-1